MGPERAKTAAATVGALTGQLPRGSLGVIAFWSDASVVLRLGDRRDPRVVMRTLLAIQARGLTNVSFPLEIAHDLVSGVSRRDTRVLLLSDCVHNSGPDPVRAAARLAHADVLIDVSGEHDLGLARQISRAAGGRLSVIRTHRDVAPALRAILSTRRAKS